MKDYNFNRLVLKVEKNKNEEERDNLKRKIVVSLIILTALAMVAVVLTSGC